MKITLIVGSSNYGGEGVISDLINFALIQGMIIVGNALGSPILKEIPPITNLQKSNLKEFINL